MNRLIFLITVLIIVFIGVLVFGGDDDDKSAKDDQNSVPAVADTEKEDESDNSFHMIM